jgi:hypothetical protein
MPNSQLMIFTAIPQSIRIDPAAAAVSVLVSPRLGGDDRLGAYPDWLHWTGTRQATGLSVTFECAGRTLAVDLPTAGLRPDLWDALFDAETLVRSHRFDDYSDRFVSSYSVRSATATIKSTYQVAAVEFAIPTTDGDPRERYGRRRSRFESLVRGYAMNWSEDAGQTWRDRQAGLQQGQGGRLASLSSGYYGSIQAALGPDGQFETGSLDPESPQFNARQADLVQQFGVFSHVPPGAPVSRAALDDANVLDFHQALSSLNAYRALQRMLGLAFDVQLPLDFLAEATDALPGELRIRAVAGPWNADMSTIVPVTSTAYLNFVWTGRRIIALAPRAFVEPGQPLGSLGLLNLDRARYGVAQVDVDGAMHKTVMLADTISQSPGESRPQHPEVFDPTTVLSSLRSGGFSLFADARALALLDTFKRSKVFNEALEKNTPQPLPFYAEDLARGYRLDIWDSVTGEWHSLHRKNTTYLIGDPATEVTIADEEGFFQVGATQAAPDANGNRARDDLYLHEAIARWNGWSLSAKMVGRHLTRAADPDHAVPDDANPDPESEKITSFKMSVTSAVVPGSLPRLRFGAAYRLRVRVVDLAGNGLTLDDAETGLLAPVLSLPLGDGTVPYLRFEPIAAPVVVLRDVRGVTGEGSSVDRLVIRTFNADLSKDDLPADRAASDRHIAPPRSSLELAERHGMLDDADGRLVADPAMWQLISQRDAATFNEAPLPGVVIDGKTQSAPLEPDPQVDPLPYLPDALARGAALRDLPGTVGGTIGRVGPGGGPDADVAYEALDDPHPRPGSATIVEFGGRDDWQRVLPFRLALDDGDGPPRWDPAARLLTVSLPKGHSHVAPLSSWCEAPDLKVLGVWRWLQEYVEFITVRDPESEFFRDQAAKDRLAHVLQLAAEGGHGMLTPPHLVTFVHAVQQPIGRPSFGRLDAQFETGEPSALRTQPEGSPPAGAELDTVTSWRRFGSTDASLVGALAVHGPSTARVDIRADWTDPIDDLNAPGPAEQAFAAPVDEVPLATLDETYLRADGGKRTVGYYDADHQLMCFAPAGARLGNLASGTTLFTDAVPVHRIGDTRHHVISYIAVATSRYREYFPSKDGDRDRDFTRASDSVVVHVPASMRPVTPAVLYVVPTFGWERADETNQVRSVRMGGGLRVYLDRPWFSSGQGELLGVALWRGGPVDREDWKPFISQWGQDPIWASAPLQDFPGASNFTDAVATERDLPLDARLPKSEELRRIDVAGHEVQYDADRGLWYCDLTIQTGSPTYAPFVRLALVRYQPHALVEAKVSRVVLADVAQLTPERAVTVTADPYRMGSLRVAVSGPAPRGPMPATRELAGSDRPTVISVTVQERGTDFVSDLAWSKASSFSVAAAPNEAGHPEPDFILWSGTVRFVGRPDDLEPGRYRLLIEEHELMAGDGPEGASMQRRLIFAETVSLNDALLTSPPIGAANTAVD